MNKTIEAVLKLSSKLGSMAGFDQMSNKLADVDKKAAAYNRTQSRVHKSTNASAAAMSRFASSAALSAGAYTAYGSFVDDAAIERRLTRIGVNADATREQMENVREDLREVAQDFALPVGQVLSGLEEQIAAGDSLSEALEKLPVLAKATQASGSQFADISKTSDAISESFGLMSSEIEGAFDVLAYHGKEGKFELNEMASELPSLAPAFAALGYEGTEAVNKIGAAMQTVRRQTGSSSEAATALTDVLTKMESNTQANNFKRFGVDLRKEMEAARDSGEDLLESFIELSIEAVDGDLSKLPQLFTDKQMLVGMRALIDGLGDYRASVAAASDATGTLDRDLKMVMDDSQASIDRMNNSFKELRETMGSAIAPVATSVMDGITDGIQYDKAVMNSEEYADAPLWKKVAVLVAGNDVTDQWARSGGYVAPGDEELAKTAGDAYKTATNVERLRSAVGLTSGELPEVTDDQRLPIPSRRPTGDDRPIDIPPGLTLDVPGANLLLPTSVDLDREEMIEDLRQQGVNLPSLGGAYSDQELIMGMNGGDDVSSLPYAPQDRIAANAQLESLPDVESLTAAAEQLAASAADMVAATGGSEDLDIRPNIDADLSVANAQLESLSNARHGDVEAFDYDGLIDAGGNVANAMTEGGLRAGEHIVAAGPQGGDVFGQTASAAITAGAASAGAAFGDAAAARINAAAKNLEGAAGRRERRGRVEVNANRGRTMENAGIAE